MGFSTRFSISHRFNFFNKMRIQDADIAQHHELITCQRARRLLFFTRTTTGLRSQAKRHGMARDADHAHRERFLSSYHGWSVCFEQTNTHILYIRYLVYNIVGIGCTKTAACTSWSVYGVWKSVTTVLLNAVHVRYQRSIRCNVKDPKSSNKVPGTRVHV